MKTWKKFKQSLVEDSGDEVLAVELDEADNTAAVAKQVKQAMKKYTSGKVTVRSKGGNTRFIMVMADKIDNKLRKMILDIAYPKANVRGGDMDNISYGNISDKIISVGVDVWVKALGLKESVELDEAWTADSVIKNAEIGSKKGYGINIKKTGGVTKTPFKHMLMTMQKHKNVRVTFDHGKDEFEGTPQSVALYINKKLGIKESVELGEGAMKEFWQDIHDELKKAMDKKWYREMQSSNGGQGLDNIISNIHKQLYGKGDPEPKDIADAIVAKYGRNHKEYMKLSLDMMRRNESVELGEAESLHWSELDKEEREDFLQHSKMSKSLASKKWNQISRGDRAKLIKMIDKSTEGEFALEESLVLFDTMYKKKNKNYQEMIRGLETASSMSWGYQDAPDQKESVELGEASPKIKYAKIVKGIRDSQGPFAVVAIKNGKVVAQKNSIKNSKMLPIEVNDMADAHPGATISIESKGGEILNTFKESVTFPTADGSTYWLDEMPANSMGGTFAAGQVGEPGAIAGVDMPLGKKKKKNPKGCEVFTVDTDTFSKCVGKKPKNKRWGKFVNTESDIGKKIRKYSLRNPNRGIIIQDETTGKQVYVRRRWNDNRLQHNKKKN